MGTYKHTECLKFADKETHICSRCKSIPSLQSFKRHLLLRAERNKDDGTRDLSSIRYEYLTNAEAVKVSRAKNKEIESKESSLFLMQRKALGLKLRVRSLKEKIKEFEKRGDMKAICHQLTVAEQAGILDDKKVLLDTLEAVANNFQAKAACGRRYK